MKETKGQNVQKLKQKSNLKNGRYNSNCSRGNNHSTINTSRSVNNDANRAKSEY